MIETPFSAKAEAAFLEHFKNDNCGRKTYRTHWLHLWKASEEQISEWPVSAAVKKELIAVRKTLLACANLQMHATEGSGYLCLKIGQNSYSHWNVVAAVEGFTHIDRMFKDAEQYRLIPYYSGNPVGTVTQIVNECRKLRERVDELENKTPE